MEFSEKLKSNKIRINIPNLPKPWLAYMHLGRKIPFYFNTVTGKSVWEFPGNNFNPDFGTCTKPPGTKKRTLLSETQLYCKRKKPVKRLSNDIEMAECNSSETLNECERREPLLEPMELDIDEDIRFVRENLSFSDDFNTSNQPSLLNSTDKETSETINGCAIFDTCSMIQVPTIVDISSNNQVISVIPYTVIKELDRLKCSEKIDIKIRAIRAINRLDNLTKNKDPYLAIENSSEAKTPVSGFEANNNDDFILKCAFRIKTELEKIYSVSAKSVIFVTEDRNLAVKGRVHDIECCNVKEYMSTLREDTFNYIAQNNKNTLEESRRLEKPIDPLLFNRTYTVLSSKMKAQTITTTADTFLHMWTHTTQIIVERSKLNLDLLSRKAKTDISRLQISATEFLRTMSPVALSVLVDLVTSFYQFYVISTCFPKSQKLNKVELLKEINSSGSSSHVLNEIQKFIQHK